MKRRKAVGTKARSRPESLVNRIAAIAQRPTTAALDAAQLMSWRDTYLAVRQAALDFNNKVLPRMLPPEAIGSAAANLGMLEGRTITLGSEDEIVVVADHAIYNSRSGGKTVIERLYEQDLASLSPVQAKWLRGAMQAIYTLLLLGEAIPGFGLWAHDILSGERLFLMDVNFSRSCPEGLTLATRVVSMEGFFMTTGAPLPVTSPEALARIGEYLDRVCRNVKDLRTLPAERAMLAEAFIARVGLEFGGSERVRYASP